MQLRHLYFTPDRIYYVENYLEANNYYYDDSATSSQIDYCKKGIEYLKFSNFEDAIRCFNFALKETADPRAYKYRAICYYRQFRQETNSEKKVELLTCAIVDSHDALDKSDKSDKKFAQQVKLDLSTMYHDRGKIYFTAEDHENAKHDFHYAIEYNSGNMASLLFRASIFENHFHEKEKAIADYLSVITYPNIHPANKSFETACKYLREICNQDKNAYSDVLSALTKSFEHDTRFTQILFAKVMLMLDAAKSAATEGERNNLLLLALADCKEAIKSSPDDEIFVCMRGVVYETSGELATALHDYFAASKMAKELSESLPFINEKIIDFLLSHRKREHLSEINRDDIYIVFSKLPADYANFFFRKCESPRTLLGKFTREATGILKDENYRTTQYIKYLMENDSSYSYILRSEDSISKDKKDPKNIKIAALNESFFKLYSRYSNDDEKEDKLHEEHDKIFEL